MTVMTSETQSAARGRGRPRIDDRDSILANFAIKIAQGQSISQIARNGLKIYGYQRGSQGKWQLELVRQLKPQLLERRYRQIIAEREEDSARVSVVTQSEGTRFIGISMPQPSVSFSHDKIFSPGRPKKNGMH